MELCHQKYWSPAAEVLMRFDGAKSQRWVVWIWPMKWRPTSRRFTAWGDGYYWAHDD